MSGIVAFRRGLAVWCGATLLAGCSFGGIGAIGPIAAAPPPEPAAPPPVAYGAFLDGPVGQMLSAADRDKALATAQEALASGQRKAWRGTAGTYGFVEVAAGEAGPAAAPPAGGAASCRAFTSTIYIAGRPKVGHGRGCQDPDGSYRIVG